jgi:hypothetical protein
MGMTAHVQGRTAGSNLALRRYPRDPARATSFGDLAGIAGRRAAHDFGGHSQV